jgi:hypothetical protein
MRFSVFLAVLWTVAAEDKTKAFKKCGFTSMDVFSYKMRTLEEKETLLEQHRGNVILLVNVATF